MAKAPMYTLQLPCIQIAIALLLFTQAKRTIETSAHPNRANTSCTASERSALLAFLAGLSQQPANTLSSWKGDDCCRWKGVYCGNKTGRVVKLDLRGNLQFIGGTISSSLLGLQHLRYLDLSNNGFYQVQIPEFIGSLHKLRYLDLSASGFIGRIPPQLGNLSNLRYLNLKSFPGAYPRDITWLSRLTSLEHLDMSYVNLSTIVHWLPVVTTLPSLKVLHLSGCHLTSSPDSLDQHSNLTSLETLDISANNFHTRSTPNWFWDLTSLKYLEISFNGFYGPFPDEIGNMTSIVELDLSANNLVGMIPSNMANLCTLERFDSGYNNINGSITELFERLPSCSWNKLRYLSLMTSNLTGSLPTTLEPLSNLSVLDLAENKLTGHVPLWIGELAKLEELFLNSNNLVGVMHEGHLSQLGSLRTLELSDNSIAITVSPAWVPPFNLEVIELRSCHLGPKFPIWLRWQTQISSLDISNTSISEMVPAWFWITASSVSFLNVQNNQITGVPPSTMELMRADAMDLSSNYLSGPIPKLPVNLTILDA